MVVRFAVEALAGSLNSVVIGQCVLLVMLDLYFRVVCCVNVVSMSFIKVFASIC